MALTKYERKARSRIRIPLGRPRDVLGAREPNGRRQRAPAKERQDEVMSVAINQPHRRGDGSPLLGFALGRLLYTKQISAEQFEAGRRYGHLAAKHMNMHGFKHKWPSAAIARMVGGTWASFKSDSTDEADEVTERQWTEAIAILMDGGLFPKGVNSLARICLMDHDPLSVDDLGTARQAMNLLHKAWK